ncbi:MAG: translation initiation factor IF-2 subunit alpha [Nanoarchaeota archaeon]
MFYKKSGFPGVGELVLCTVKKIAYHSVFVSLDEYENREGMIHISEVSPGRIRTLGDFVKEGKKIVCKVLNFNKEDGRIDLSLRRVSVSEKINKNNEYKQEQKAEKLFETAATKFNKDLKWVYDNFGYNIIERYGSLNTFLQSILEKDESILKEISIPKNIIDTIYKLAKEKIKSKEVNISGNIILKSFQPDGINIIKRVLLNAEKGGIKVMYIGSPKYRVSVTAKDYKSAEEILKESVNKILNEIKGYGEGEFLRTQ